MGQGRFLQPLKPVSGQGDQPCTGSRPASHSIDRQTRYRVGGGHAIAGTVAACGDQPAQPNGFWISVSTFVCGQETADRASFDLLCAYHCKGNYQLDCESVPAPVNPPDLPVDRAGIKAD